jgi:hypothetical protein
LLPFNRKEQILNALGVTENTLVDEWKSYMKIQ